MRPPLHPIGQALTGKVRFRQGWGGKMIAEVQESYRLGFLGTPTNEKVHYRWRDATFYDIQSLSPLSLEDYT